MSNKKKIVLELASLRIEAGVAFVMVFFAHSIMYMLHDLYMLQLDL
jgi:hypothetical protein